jgi:hypothetical protein
MSFVFKPLTEEEIDAMSLMDEGIYNFQVETSNPRTSKSGNRMAELLITVWDSFDKPHSIYDYLVFSTIPLNIRKVKHFCDTVGLTEEYKKGSIPEGLASLSGKVKIGIQEEKANPNGGFFPKKNIVIDYVMTDKGAVKSDSAPIEEEKFHDDDLPF